MPEHRAWSWYRASLVGSDALLLGVAFLMAAWARSSIGFLPYQPQFEVNAYGPVALAVIPGLVTILWLRGAYAPQHLLGGPEEYAHIVNGCTYGMLLVLGASYLYDTAPTVSRGWLLLFWGLAVVFVGTGRFTLRRVVYRLRRRGWFVRRVLIAGASDQGVSIAQQLHNPHGHGIEVVGFVDDYTPAGASVGAWTLSVRARAPVDEFRILGHSREATAIAAEYRCHLLIVVPGALSWESQQRLSELASSRTNNLEVRLAPTLYDLTAAGLEPAPLGYIPLVRLQTTRLVGTDAALRATFDAALALLLLAIFAPVMGWLVAHAWVGGCRPVFMRRHVLGQGGRPVSLTVLNPAISQRILVRGLPALLAVVTGHLALAGPRPVPIEEELQYQPWLGILRTVRPGLTGAWRLGNAGGSTEEQVQADLWWIRNWTIWQHVFVIVQTAGRVLKPGQAQADLVRWQPLKSADRPARLKGELASVGGESR